MDFKWDPGLSIGIGEVDIQHREIINRINYIVDSAGKGKSPEKTAETIEFLESYAEKHFETEEKIMTVAGYPGTEEHKKLHASFIKRIEAIAAAINKGELKGKELYEIGEEIYAWFERHITTADREMGEFIKARMHR